jgi:amino acid transporter
MGFNKIILIIKKAIPYIYLIVGISFVAKGFYAIFNELDIYYLIFSLETKSKSIYVLFNLFFGGLILFTGIRRLQSMRK